MCGPTNRSFWRWHTALGELSDDITGRPQQRDSDERQHAADTAAVMIDPDRLRQDCWHPYITRPSYIGTSRMEGTRALFGARGGARQATKLGVEYPFDAVHFDYGSVAGARMSLVLDSPRARPCNTLTANPCGSGAATDSHFAQISGGHRALRARSAQRSKDR
jgi:hypothetical protein